MSTTLTFAIVGDDRGVTFDALYRVVEDIRRLVIDVDQVVTQRARGQRVRAWYIEAFHSSDPTITIRPGYLGADSGERTAVAVVDGIRWVSDAVESAPPPYFSERELEDLLAIRRWRTAGVSRADFAVETVDIPEAADAGEQREVSGKTAALVPGRIEEQVNRILRSGDAEMGSIEGVLDALNLHRTPSMTIWDSITGLAVRCSFPREFEDQVRGLLRHRVRVSGLVHYFADGRPRRVTDFAGIENLDAMGDGPRASFGSIPDLTGGRGSVEHLRILRAE